MSWACDPALTSTLLESYQVAGPVFVNTLQTFLAAQCAIVGDHLWPEDATQEALKDPNYDFIVVGAGSAGAVVANRLSEIPQWKVLLVEAGGNPTLSTETPQVFYNNLLTSVDWGYTTQPQDGACRAYRNRGCAWPRGKVLGGSSSINAMFYVRGNKADYDQWAADGNYGWSYNEVLPYFLKSENFTGIINGENKKYHSQTGYINIMPEGELHPFEDTIIQAAGEVGLKHSNDINGASQMGITASQTNIRDNVRLSTARAFLSPNKNRKNLHVIKNAYVTKLLFVPGTNTINGVVINKDGKDIVIHARKEVIVSAGSINSPQLLMLSGIGPEKHLKEMNIEVKADLPVGENLQDHLFTFTFYSSPNTDSVSMNTVTEGLAQYMFNRSGILKDTKPHRVISFLNTKNPDSSIPDIQQHFLVSPPSLYNLLDTFKKHDLSDEAIQKFNKMSSEKLTILVANVLLYPKSRGKILLASNNPFDYPLIHANYFDDPEDMATLVKSIKQYTLTLGDTKSFQNAGLKLDWLELEACKGLRKSSDEYLECMAREITFSLYHPTSTCKMGPEGDESAVVDPELRVRKVKGLRVIDASIMPNIVRGNTNAPSIMIGEKGADLVKQTWLSERTEL